MFVFRADGNSIIGAGHVMRCLSIANAAKEMGIDCLFVLASDDFKNVVIKNGHRVQVLNTDFSKMNPKEIIEPVKENKPAVVIVDSYYVTEGFMAEVHKGCNSTNSKLVYIDDRCENAYSCDVLVNYNISADVEAYRKLYMCKREPVLLIGTEYVPLRKEFQTLKKRIVSNKPKNILVSTGGADTEHLLLSIIDEAVHYDDFLFHIVIGMMNSDRELIREKTKELKNIFIYENVTRMDELMWKCDVAISASGSTLYELCATQTPTITYILADNQIPLATCFYEQGVTCNCGDIRIIGNKRLAKALINSAIELIDNYDKRLFASKKMVTVVDGKGAMRIVEAILSNI